MKMLSVLKKSIIEILRDYKTLIMAVSFGPLFMLIFYIAYGNQFSSYNVLVYNQDKTIMNHSEEYNAGKMVVEKLKEYKNKKNESIFKVTLINNFSNAMNDIKNKAADALVEIPEDFSKNILNQKKNPSDIKTEFTMHGDIGYEKYMISAITIYDIIENLINKETNIPKPFKFKEVPIQTYDTYTEFEYSMPAVILLGLIMLIFTTAIALVKEVDSGTIRRLQISKLSTTEFLTSITISQLILAVIATIISYLLAKYGFNIKINWSLPEMLFICLLCSFGIIAIGLILAGLSKTVSEIMIVGNLPYFLLLLFSGALPLPRINLFWIGSTMFALNDIFPTTLCITILKKIFYQNATLGMCGFEITLMVILCIVYFAAGVGIFYKNHMKLS